MLSDGTSVKPVIGSGSRYDRREVGVWRSESGSMRAYL